jgi:hypothetical protein
MQKSECRREYGMRRGTVGEGCPEMTWFVCQNYRGMPGGFLYKIKSVDIKILCVLTCLVLNMSLSINVLVPHFLGQNKYYRV